MSATKNSCMQLTSFHPSVLGTNKNETSFGLEMSQTGFSSHVVEVRMGLELPSHPLTLLGYAIILPFLSCLSSPLLSFLGSLYLSSLWLEEGHQDHQ